MSEKPNTPQEQPSFLNWLGFTHTPDFRKARWLGPILGALLAVFVAILFAGAGWAAFRTLWIGGDSHAANAAAGGLGAGALIVAVLGAPFLFWRTWIAQQTQRFQKEGHITDRITKAVEQLGVEKTVKVERQASPAKRAASTEKKSAGEAKDFIERTVPNIEVRIGAILALERMSQDSMRYDKGRDHVRIMEILCAYIRHNAPAEGGGAFYEGDKTRNEISTWAGALKPPRADIAMALTVLVRRDDAQRAKEGQWPHPSGKQGYRLDLRGTCLQRADLTYGHFEKALFEGARMEGANLGWAHLEGAILREAHLEGAKLRGAHLERAKLRGAHLKGAILWQAQLEGADLRWAHLKSAILWRAQLEGTDLRGAHLEDANLWGAHLKGAYLMGAHLEGAHLRGARLQNTDLSSCKNLTQAQIDAAFGDGSVILPEGIKRPKHWPQGKLDDATFKTEYESWLQKRPQNQPRIRRYRLPTNPAV